MLVCKYACNDRDTLKQHPLNTVSHSCKYAFIEVLIMFAP